MRFSKSASILVFVIGAAGCKKSEPAAPLPASAAAPSAALAAAPAAAAPTGPWNGKDVSGGRSVTAADVQALKPGEPLTLELAPQHSVIKFDPAKGPIDFARVVVTIDGKPMPAINQINNIRAALPGTAVEGRPMLVARGWSEMLCADCAAAANACCCCQGSPALQACIERDLPSCPK
jgi:hypothetical protein